MTRENPLSDARDERLGAMLRDHLEGTDPDRFVARVRSRLAAATMRLDEESLWDVLAAWARPGIAAGFLLATLVGGVLAARAARNLNAGRPGLAQAVERDELVSVVLGSTR